MVDTRSQPFLLRRNCRHERPAWRGGLGGLLLVALLAACTRSPAPAEPVRAVRSVVIGAASSAGRQEYAAEVKARTESRLGFRVAGKLVERPVQIGDAVRKGQVLARLDPGDLQLVEESAAAAVQAAAANAAQAEADLRRFRGLHEQGFISAAELERRATASTAARAQLTQARAQADVQASQTGHGTLRADAAGVITAVEAEPGAVLAAGTPVVRLAWDGPRDVVFAVPEDQVPLVRSLAGRAGALSVSLWGQPGGALRATVREVAAAADPVTRTFTVKADLPAAPSRAGPRIGQTAVVAVELPRVDGVIRLPLSALVEHQGRSSVWLLDPASLTVSLQPVVVVGADGNDVVIGGGLRPGQEVVTAGVHVLAAGQKVRRHGAAPASGGVAASAAR